MQVKHNVHQISKSYYFLTSTERALFERSLMDWHLQNYVQRLVTPETTLAEVIDSVLFIETMNDVELIENMAAMETLTFGGEWQGEEPKEGSMILAIRPVIYNLFKAGRAKTVEDFFEEQNWNYEGQFVKKMQF